MRTQLGEDETGCQRGLPWARATVSISQSVAMHCTGALDPQGDLDSLAVHCRAYLCSSGIVRSGRSEPRQEALPGCGFGPIEADQGCCEPMPSGEVCDGAHDRAPADCEQTPRVESHAL